MAQDNKRTINRVKVDNFGHASALREANRRGMDLGDFVGALVSSWAIAIDPETGEMKDVEGMDLGRFKIGMLSFKMQQHHRMCQLVREAAVIHTQHPDDVSADELAEMCELAGMDLAEIMDIANTMEFKSMLQYSRDGSKYGECMTWLAYYMSDEGKDGKGVPVSQIFAVGKSSGFDEQMIRRAKRSFRHDPLSPSIESKRVSRGWVWHIKKREEENTS